MRRRLVLVAGAAAAAGAYRRLTARPRPGSPYLAGAPLLIAHRGGGGLAPENTAIAFERAVRWWGADVLELDVQPTRDGEAVVFHDATVDRTTDGAGRVDRHSLEELRRLDAGHAFTADGGATFPFRGVGVGVPTLAEILAAFPAHRVNIEIKDGRAQARVAEVVEAAGAWRRVLIAAGRRADRSGLDGRPVARSASEEELRAFYLHHRLYAASLARVEVDALQLPERHGGARIVGPRFVRDAHARNLAVHVWTVNDEADMRRLLRWGVDGIVTDRPDRLARVLHERTGRPLPPGPPSGSGGGPELE